MIREMLKRKEVEKALRCGRLAVYAMIARGELHAVKVGNCYLFPAEEVEALQRGERPAAGR